MPSSRSHLASPRKAALSILAFATLLAVGVPRSAAQSLVEMYRSARFRAQAERIFEEKGRRAHVRSPDGVPYATDSMRMRISTLFPLLEEPERVREPAYVVRDWDLIPKLGRGWFEKEFRMTTWSFLGSNTLTPLDTTFTRELRARFEEEFGAPTQTIAELNQAKPRQNSDFVQFEYWFVLNDSIPLKVMDVNGPFERGVVVASDHRFRELLPELKKAFLGRIANSAEKAPYVDYYYLPEQNIWFLTGYDGRRFFVERILRPNLRLGRPLLENVPAR